MVARKGAGALNCRVTFQRRDVVQDEYGNDVTGEFVDVFSISARLAPQFNGRLSVEGVTAARLAALQPHNLTVRSCADTRAVRADWRVYDARKGKIDGKPLRSWNIKTIVNPDERGQYIEMLVVEGEAS
ncbi:MULTISPECIES: head-tail adaptor protein [unclassified Mesorhizobium]|uniref:head-tail adaptor protein n=1 Tax=unclassified Mesorhizobium TaxID=325217 RepID=UPI000FD91E21|nr:MULTISPECIES: head-tail adaptor protein [unclassified Mesorhizobium]TGR58261.1 head-tail adaptor protein [bacterium M00.F.Ca.ET.199.01.1.1]TGU41631.1 head-tail adaptor protein [bacterium M00.F.Ca.ET.156.01.1.1]TGV89745.1 head-tail adaptor protein [Mesorhizobium sp. M00.F.Ca.ET.149.01.1.1]TGR33003.1 head-tail adaptor protein [Mesorhizobium sp. M8A.F.Ca.ET.197.01.1.1]TGR34649.1 head-tail adaptor protein [Mesorhizobium sp. M8A.F.Ca.ET.202.01.1.1]